MSAHVLFNLLNDLRNSVKMRDLTRTINQFFATSLLNSMLQDHGC